MLACRIAIAAAFALPGVLAGPPARAQLAPAMSCTVEDPTGTPLNVRDGPNGAILGQLENGEGVLVVLSRLDDRERPWVLVQKDDEVLGWVFGRYLAC